MLFRLMRDRPAVVTIHSNKSAVMKATRLIVLHRRWRTIRRKMRGIINKRDFKSNFCCRQRHLTLVKSSYAVCEHRAHTHTCTCSHALKCMLSFFILPRFNLKKEKPSEKTKVINLNRMQWLSRTGKIL